MPQAAAAAIVSFVGLTGTAATIATAVISIGISAGVSKLTTPSSASQNSSQEREAQVVAGDASGRLIYGLAKVGTKLNMAQTYNDYVYIGGLICRHPIEEIVTVYIGDKPSTHPDFSDVELAKYRAEMEEDQSATGAGVATLTVGSDVYTYAVQLGDSASDIRTALSAQLVTTSEIAFSESSRTVSVLVSLAQGSEDDDVYEDRIAIAIDIERQTGTVVGWDLAVSFDTDEANTGISSDLEKTDGHAETKTEHRILYSLGDHTTADPTLVSELDFVDASQRWTSDHKSLGFSWINIRFPQKFVRETLGGIPSITLVVRGHNGITDYRTGDVGYSTNPLLCFQHWAMSKYGPKGGVSADLFDQAAWNAEADVCDEQVIIDAEGNTQDRYSFNTVISLETIKGDIEQLVADAVQAPVMDYYGQYLIRPARYREPVLSLVLDDLSGGDIQFLHKPPNSSRLNQVRGTFIDPYQGWSSHDYPPVVIDDGYAEQIGNVSFIAEIDGIRAQRLSMLNLNLSRRAAPLTLPIKRLKTVLHPDDFVKLSMPEIDIDDEIFYVSERSDNDDCTAVLTLLPRAEIDYAWDYTLVTEIQTVTPVPLFKVRQELF